VPTTNQSKLIATLGTPTSAATVEPVDIHLKNGAPVPHPNDVPTSKSTAGMTSTQTTIAGKQIVLQEATLIGPPSNSAWPGEVGKKSGTTGMEAIVKKGSPNVTAEKLAIARYNDPTLQNHQNCDGKVIITDEALAAAMLEQQKLLRCKMQSLHTVCGHGRTADVKKKYISVLVGDTIDLVATRINALEFKGDGSLAGAAAECGKAPLHTHFVVTRSMVKTPWADFPAKTQTYTGSDTLTLGPDWLGTPPPEPKGADGKPQGAQVVNAATGSTQGARGGGKSAAATNPGTAPTPIPRGEDPAIVERGFRMGNQVSKPKMPLGPDKLTTTQRERLAQVQRDFDINTRNNRADQAKYDGDTALKASRERADKIKGRDAAIEATLVILIDVIKCLPCKITVEAQSCAGVEKVDVWVWPRGRYMLDIVAFVQPIKDTFDIVAKTVKLFADVFKASGARAKIEMKFFEGPWGVLTWQWKEKPNHQIAPEFMIEVGFAKLAEVKGEVRIPVLTFAGPLGRAAVWVLEKINLRGDIGIFATVSLSISVGGSMFDWNFAPGPMSVRLTFEAGIFAELTLGDWATFKVEAKAVWRPLFSPSASMSNGRFLGVTLLAGKVEFKWEVTIQADFIGFRNGRKFNGEIFPPFHYGQQTLNLLPDAPAAQRTG
jgi:hypothetical protein